MLKQALFLIASLPALAQPQTAKKTIFMITDAEGVAGVCRQDQTDPKNAEMRQLLTGEINAAVQGFFSGGATEVIVWDGHDGSQTLSALEIDPRAKLVMGGLGPTMLLERRFAGIAFVGQHSKAGTPRAVMAHSYNSLGIQNMLLNGKPVGEIETRAALAGAFDTPVIFLAGDQAAADDLKAIAPQAELAVVKEGLGYYPCLTLSAVASRNLIEATARRSMEKLGSVKPYRIAGPATLEIEYSTRSTPFPDAALGPGVERVNPRTIRYNGKDFLEAWTRYSGR